MAHIVLVDDDAFVVYTLRKILLNAGHTVESFDNGGKALEQLRRHAPDLVITDVVMPGMGGLQLLSELRAANLDTKVLVISAGSTDFAVDFKEVAARSGANGVLMKPFDRSTFLACVATLLP